MFDLSKLIITEPCLSNGGKFIILSATPKKQYLDGKYTDVIEGYKVDVCAISNDFEKFSVTVSEKPDIPEDMYRKAAVQFVNFEGKIYKNFKSNQYDLACKAKSVNLVKTQ